MEIPEQKFEDNVVEVPGILAWDPRVSRRVGSSNPALVFGYLITKVYGWKVDDEFWDGIGRMANFCEMEVSNEKDYLDKGDGATVDIQFLREPNNVFLRTDFDSTGEKRRCHKDRKARHKGD